MPYQLDAQTIARLIPSALADDEVHIRLNRDHRLIERVEGELRASIEKIRIQALETLPSSSTFAALRSAEKELEGANQHIQQAIPPRPFLAGGLQAWFWLLLSSIVIALLAPKISEELQVKAFAALLFYVSVLAVVILYCLRGFARWRYDRTRTKAIEKAEQTNRLPSRQAALEALMAQADAELVKGPILAEARLIVNRVIGRSYALVLTQLPTSYGLAEGLHSSQTIDTEARSRLRGCFESMPGGTIGLAGPRGAGKSTLIKACHGLESLKGKEVLTVQSAAPVEYDSREFLLYLFSTLCDRILDKVQQHRITLPAPPKKPALREVIASLLLARWLGFLLGLAGIALTVVAVLLGVMLASNPEKVKHSTDPAQTTKKNDPGDPSLASGSDGVGVELTFTSFLRACELKPGNLLTNGLLIFGLGMAQLYVSWRVAKGRKSFDGVAEEPPLGHWMAVGSGNWLSWEFRLASGRRRSAIKKRSPLVRRAD